MSGLGNCFYILLYTQRVIIKLMIAVAICVFCKLDTFLKVHFWYTYSLFFLYMI